MKDLVLEYRYKDYITTGYKDFTYWAHNVESKLIQHHYIDSAFESK